LGRKKACFF